jgi:DNA polymerase alpha subunit A
MLSKASRRDKLKELREARNAGTSIKPFNEEVEEEIYDEVDEDTYREHKRNQLMNDDFIVDDDGEGYVDNGVDEWDDSTRPKYYSDEEEDTQKKRKRKDQKPLKVAKTAQINSFFKPTSAAAPIKKVDTNIDDILDDFQDDVPVKKQKRENHLVFGASTKSSNTKKKLAKTFDFGTSSKKVKSRKIVKEELDESLDLPMDINEQPSSPIKTIKEEIATNEKENIDPTVVEKESEDESDDDSDDDIVVTRRTRAAAPSKTTVLNFSSVKASDIPSSSPIRATSHSAISHTEKLDKDLVVNAESQSESFKMFWLDYCEIDSTLLLFGKIMTREGKLVSGVVQVNGLARELYFLPREFRRTEDEDDEKVPVTALDVHEEIAPLLLKNFNLEVLKAKPETMKYAFELPGVPKETEYLKVLLPFKTPKNRNLILPASLEGDTFNHVFGAATTIFEAFVIQRNIMGPCWIEV